MADEMIEPLRWPAPGINLPGENSELDYAAHEIKGTAINGNRVYFRWTLPVAGNRFEASNYNGNWSTWMPNGHFHFGYNTIEAWQTGGGLDSEYATRKFWVRPPRPIMDWPTDNEQVPSRTPEFRGTSVFSGGPNSGPIDIRVVNAANSAEVWATGTVDKLSRKWSARATTAMPFGVNQVRILQYFQGREAGQSDMYSFRVAVDAPTILEPSSAPTTPRPIFKGNGLNNAVIEIWNENESGGRLEGGAVFGSTWEIHASKDWSPGTHRVKAFQRLNGQGSGWSNTCVFTVALAKPPTPDITPPPSPAEPNQQLTITGVASGSVTLKMQNGAGSPVGGSFSGSGTTRTFTPNPAWVPGRGRTVKVVQTVDNVDSDPSDVRTFSVKPPKPAISQPSGSVLPDQALSITGVYSGTVTLRMQDGAGNSVGGSFSGSGTTRTFTPNPAWVPGSGRTVKVVQTVDNVDSDPSDVRTFSVKPPKAAISQPSGSVLPDQMLTITGVASGSVTLKMLTGAGDEILGSFSTSGATRTFTPAQNWVPGDNTVKVVQTVNGVPSDASNTVTFKAKPSKPAIISPADPASPRQTLNVTNVYSGSVALKILDGAGAEVSGSFSGSDTARTFTPIQNWAPGYNTVTVVQTVNGVASDKSEPCTFKARPQRPSMEQPPSPAEPNQTLTITSVHPDATKIQVIHDISGEVLGSFTGVGSTRTFTPEQNWVPGDRKVFVMQTVNGVISTPSIWFVFSVKPLVPTITDPEHEGKTSGQLPRLEGKGYSGSTIEVQYLDETPVVDDVLVTDGDWAHPASIPWNLGTHTLKVRQTFNGQASDWSDPHTFDVIPGQPSFTEPEKNSETSSLPTISGKSLGYADVTVRLKDGRVLFTQTADVDGVWSGKVTVHLDSVSQLIEAQQEFGGHVSDWSEVHSFTVKKDSLYQPPGIIAPRHGGSMGANNILFRGTGLDDLQVKLSVKQGDEEKTDEVPVKSRLWSSHKRIQLEAGAYTWQVQHRSNSGESDWTAPRNLTITAAAFEFAEVGPVIGRPVVDNGESVLLRVQAVSTETGEGIEGLEVEWSVDEQAVMATTVTGPRGWASYRYTPDSAGEHLVLADLTNENEGVVVVQPFEVTALQRDAWAREFELWLDGYLVDLAKMDLLLLGEQPHLLTLIPKKGSPLIGLTHVSLEGLHGVAELGLEVDPPLGTAIPLREGELTTVWTIKASTKSGFFGLKLSSPKLPDWQLPGRVITGDLAEEVAVRFDTFPMVFGHGTAYLCHGATHTVTVQPEPHSLLLGMDVKLEWSGEVAAGLGVVVTPKLEDTQRLVPDGVTWTLNCANSIKNGSFSLRLSVPEWDFRSLELPMSLGHNKVKRIETDGPRELGSGSHPYWRYGIRVASTFTGQAAGGVPVTVYVTGRPPITGSTQSDGWIYVHYYEGESAYFHIYNPYDGSSS